MAFISGGIMPGMSILMGSLLDTLNIFTPPEEILEDMKLIAIIAIIVAVVIWIIGFVYYSFW